MTSNSKLIIKYAEQYKEMYYNQFNEYPTCWFSYLRWLASCTFSGNYTQEEIEIAQRWY